MMAPIGIVRSSVTGGGDCLTLDVTAVPMLLRSSDVPCGVNVPVDPSLRADAEGVRRCLVRYEADRGRLGLGLDCREDRRLATGDADADEAGDRCEGGV